MTYSKNSSTVVQWKSTSTTCSSEPTRSKNFERRPTKSSKYSRTTTFTSNRRSANSNKKKIEYLGVIISKGHAEMDPAKVAGIIDWPEPKTVKEVQAFLGFCNFYRRFIKDFSHLAQPLFALTRKDMIFNWSNKPKKAFEEIKQIFTLTPVLAIPDTQKPMRIECDS